MINLTQTFTLLTPCFCTGADQNQAEIRSASIRGQLRWWFRILGGTPEMENNVFGGVHNDTKASRIILRLTDSKPIYGQPGMLPQRNNTPGYYLFHFAKVSNGGIRYQKKAFLAPGSTFTVQCLERKTMDREEQRLLEKSWRAFSLLGALGLRATRACGAFQTEGLT
ncbi:MAG: type III-B CRISPR module RAMP protein Cmr1, partial [Oligosphaeraceae bacterium]|nr:type III-B CRISPR module RAMP protein Cmr1 [Oligosphaeraceae bacterium]